MSQHYSNPARETDPHALPDVEVFDSRILNVECPHCGDFEAPDCDTWADIMCPSCGGAPATVGYVSMADGSMKHGWFWQSCFPGCLPDGDPIGPFATRAEALADAQQEQD